MKTSLHCLRLVLGAALSVAPPVVLGQAAPAPATTPGTPRIQFSEASFDFGKVKPEDTLKHDFIVTNTGTATLEITAVQPGCGCTTAGAWDRLIEPGKTGKIPIQLNPISFSGPVSKGVTVNCNDPAQPSHYLHIHATVWRPIDVQPQYAYFMPVIGEETNETKIVRIVNSTEEDLTLEAPQSASALFKPELKTVRPGKEFELHITYFGPVSNASPQGAISIKTSSAAMPMITVNAVTMTQPAVVAYPGTLALPAGPFKAEYPTVVTVRNNSRSPLKLSAPTVNLVGVKVTIHEIDPGRMMNLSLTFPAGFQLLTGQSAELTVTTSHPKYPTLQVPITQLEPVPITQLKPVTPTAAPAAAPGGIIGGSK